MSAPSLERAALPASGEGGVVAPGEAAGTGESAPSFEVVLENFSGPFEVLLSLINKRSLDITEVALATVTDEFVAYLRELAGQHGARVLDEMTEFMVLASTLLDLKAARLLPRGEVEDEEDLARLEARDLLFARLLQYKAYKQAAQTLADLLRAGSVHVPRQVAEDDPDVAAALPPLRFTTTPDELAALAAKAQAPRAAAPDAVNVEHVHAQPVSVREQAGIVAARLREAGALDFGELTEDTDATLVVIARFLALLEMYRDKAIEFEQLEPLSRLVVRWREGATWRGASVEEYAGTAGVEDDGDAPPGNEAHQGNGPQQIEAQQAEGATA